MKPSHRVRRGSIGGYRNTSVGGGLSGPMKTHQLTVYPGGCDLDSNSGNNYYCFIYPKCQGVTTEQYQTILRTIAWSSGRMYAGRVLWVVYSVKPIAGAYPGNLLNFHNHPNFGGWEPDNSTGVSPIRLAWFNSGLQLFLNAEGARSGNYNPRQVLTNSEMLAFRNSGTWLDLVMKIDIYDYPNGRIKVWVQGENTPRLDTGGVRTYWPSQTAYTLWNGIYMPDGTCVPETTTIQEVIPRLGRTLQEAQENGVLNTITEVAEHGSVYRSNHSVDAYVHSEIASRDASTFLIGSGLS